MKKFILAILAATVATTPVLAADFQSRDDRAQYAQNDRRDDNRQGYQHNDRNGRSDRNDSRQGFGRDDRREPVQYRNWQRGQRFDSRYANHYRVISNPYAYRLHNAPRGYRWVQSGNDAVLIGITSGIIASVLANAIR